MALPSTSGEEMVPAVNPQGEIVDIRKADLPRALQQGFKPPDPETAKHLAALDAADTDGQGAIAALEGAGSTLTFGALPKIETAAGWTTPEAIAARKEMHPILHGAGAIAGAILPIALTGGAAAPEEGAALAAEAAPSILGRVASYTAPGLISRAGQAVGRAAEGALPGVVGRVAPAAAAAATEGALYAGSDVTERALLGDPQLTWEKAAAEIGMGGLLGGALGAGGRALHDLLPDNLAESMADKLGETAGNRNLKAAAGPGGSKAIIRRLQKQIGAKNLTEIGQEMGDLGLVGPLTTPEITLEKAAALKEVAGREMGAVLREADAAGGGAPSVDSLIARAKSEIVQPLVENPLEADTGHRIASILDGYAAKYAEQPLTFEELHEIRKQVSQKIYGLRGTQDPQATALKDALHDFRSLLSDEINTGIDKTGLASDAWRAANRKYHVASVAQKLAEDGALKHTGNNLLSLTEILAGLTGAGTHGMGAGALSALGMHVAREHASGILGWAATGAQRRLLALAAKTDKRLSGAVDAIFEGGRGAVSAAGAATGTERFAHGGVVTPERFADVSTRLSHYGSNPDRLADEIGKETRTLRAHAPTAADAANAFAARVVAHLGSKLPQDQGGPRQLLDAPFEPSRSELHTYNQHHQVAMHGPAVVLEHLAKGTLRPEHIETSAALFPKLHAEAQQLVAERLASHLGKKQGVPVHLRASLGMLLGQDLAHATTPAAILSAQSAYASAPKEKSITPKGEDIGDMRLGQRLATDTQAADSRMSGKS